jgi:hypothetical protein
MAVSRLYYGAVKDGASEAILQARSCRGRWTNESLGLKVYLRGGCSETAEATSGPGLYTELRWCGYKVRAEQPTPYMMRAAAMSWMVCPWHGPVIHRSLELKHGSRLRWHAERAPGPGNKLVLRTG